MRTDPIGYGIIGVGTWGELHARTLSADPRVRLLAICDLNGERARTVAARYGVPKVYTSYEEMLADPEIEAASVATPDFAHAEPCLAVVGAGRHLLVEKPMATSSAECVEIITAARQTGVTVMVDFHNRWSPPFAQCYTSLRNGELGELKFVYFRLSDTQYVPTRYISWGAKSSVLWFLGPHATDTVRWLYGDEVREVYAVSRRDVLKSMGIDTPDFYTMILQFENGGVAHLEHSWLLSPSTGNLFDLKCELQGSRGTVFIDTSSNRGFEKYTERTPEGYPHCPNQDVMLMYEVHGRQLGFAGESIRHFVDCLWEGRAPMVSPVDGLRSTEILEAAVRSAETGQPVRVVRREV
jgi:predicted dehydrogenase